MLSLQAINIYKYLILFTVINYYISCMRGEVCDEIFIGGVAENVALLSEGERSKKVYFA